MIEVRAEALRGHGRFQVGARRRENPDIDGLAAHAAHAPYHPVFDRRQELRLEIVGQRPHFVEEQCAAVRRLEEPGLPLPRIGEGPRLHPEQLRLEQRPGDRRAIDRDERTATPGARVVDGLGKQALAGPRLATDQHRGLPPCRRLVVQEPPHLLAQRRDRRTLPEEVSKLSHGPI